MPDSTSRFFTGLSAAERATPGLVGRRTVGAEARITRESFVSTNDASRTGSIESLAIIGDRSTDAPGAIRQTSVQIQPLAPGTRVASSELDVNSQYMQYNATEMVLSRNVNIPGGSQMTFRDFYRVRTDANGTWGVRNRHDVESRGFSTGTSSWDPNSVEIDITLPEGTMINGRRLADGSKFERTVELPQSERGMIVFHQLDYSSRVLTVRTSAGNEYKYDIELTLQNANPGWISDPPRYSINTIAKDGYPRRMAANELARYRARSTDLGRRQSAEGGTAGGMRVELQGAGAGAGSGVAQGVSQ